MPKTKKSDSTSDSDSGPEDRAPPSKKNKESSAPTEGKSNSNTWVLDRQRQVRINEFRGRKLIDIREYYEKDGKVLPGKKGISLSIAQWKKLLDVANEVDRAIAEN